MNSPGLMDGLLNEVQVARLQEVMVNRDHIIPLNLYQCHVFSLKECIPGNLHEKGNFAWFFSLLRVYAALCAPAGRGRVCGSHSSDVGGRGMQVRLTCRRALAIGKQEYLSLSHTHSLFRPFCTFLGSSSPKKISVSLLFFLCYWLQIIEILLKTWPG